MTQENLALKIGMQILNQINKIQLDKKDFGQELVIPFKLPINSRDPDFIYTLKLGMPRFTILNRNGDISSITMAEYFEWDKNEYRKTYLLSRFYDWFYF